MNEKYKQFINIIKHSIVGKSVYAKERNVSRSWFFILLTSFSFSIIFVGIGFYVFFFLRLDKVNEESFKKEKKFNGALLAEILDEYKKREFIFEENINSAFKSPKVNDREEPIVLKDDVIEELDKNEDVDVKIELSP